MMTTNIAIKEVIGYVSFKRKIPNENLQNIQLKYSNFLPRNAISFHSALKKEKNIILIHPNDGLNLIDKVNAIQSNKTVSSSIIVQSKDIIKLENIFTPAISITNSTLAGSINDDIEADILHDIPQKIAELSFKSKKIKPKHKIMNTSAIKKNQKQPGKKIYEISRFFVKNYIGALKSTVNNLNCESDILKFLGINKEGLINIRQELEKLLKQFPKHNRMQLYKLITNPKLNPIFQYFLRKKVYSWIFTSSKMQDKQAHLMARKNFLHLCLKAKDLTPYNFRIALNFK